MSELEQRNARRFIAAQGLQGLADQLINPKTILPWLLSSAGAPHAALALLVPVREAGSMLPQAWLTGWVTSHKLRSRVWIAGALGQAVSAAAIALSAALFDGLLLAVSVIAALSVLAGFRSLCSIAAKDVQGRTVSKRIRGRITGRATALAGSAALVAGVILTLYEDALPTWSLTLLLGVGAVVFVLAAMVFSAIIEPTDEAQRGARPWTSPWSLLRSDKLFRDFVIVRSLMLVSALSTTFIVVLSQEIGHDLRSLGLFVVASALAALIGGPVAGRLSDASSSSVMAWSAGISSLVIMAVIASAHYSPDKAATWALPAGFFVVQLAHTAIRVARKTYAVNLAEGDTRTLYTGAANTLMGVFLLVAGFISALLAQVGASVALAFLALVGIAGVVRAASLARN
ncbi:MFS transporter [Corynebacterium tapiri]|uniref:MFS transporter n=1 Tax=Corynebacterium tapiri TaxID=1448266 RepID=UPI001FE430CA|nr:MFS transporter [Corynebacterium tapiri]